MRAESWLDLQDKLFSDTWDEHIGRFRSPYAYRGLSHADYDLTTSLVRLGGAYDVLEPHLLRNFKKYSHREVVARDSIWHWLTMAQHHGLPTRLLDWTYSPYVALHFATSNIEHFDVDGAIWAVHYRKAHELLPKALRSKLLDEGSNVFTTDMLASALSNLKELDGMSTSDFVLFIEPPSLDDRIVNQYAMFSTMSNAQGVLSTWLKDHEEIYFKVVIPAALKWEIRDKLDQANITERVLFPGLDGLSQWLKRHYSPKR